MTWRGAAGQNNGRRDCSCPRASHQHGTLGAYKLDGCRCFPCRYAHSSSAVRYRHGGKAGDAVWLHRAGTVRRLQALATLGWSDAQIGARLGVTKQAVADIRARADHPILLATAQRVAEVYDELWSVPSIARGAVRCRRQAQAKGWLPPLAWDDDTIDDPAAKPLHYARISKPDSIDEIAVERAVRGERVRLTRAETAEAHAILNRMELSAREIAQRLHTTERTVVRRRRAA